MEKHPFMGQLQMVIWKSVDLSSKMYKIKILEQIMVGIGLLSIMLHIKIMLKFAKCFLNILKTKILQLIKAGPHFIGLLKRVIWKHVNCLLKTLKKRIQEMMMVSHHFIGKAVFSTQLFQPSHLSILSSVLTCPVRHSCRHIIKCQW